MSKVEELEKNMIKHELAFNELLIKTDRLDRQVEELLAELEISPEQLTVFLENKENFSEENWQSIVEQKQALEEKLKRELANVRNPLKTKKTYSDRIVSPNWLFVR